MQYVFGSQNRIITLISAVLMTLLSIEFLFPSFLIIKNPSVVLQSSLSTNNGRDNNYNIFPG
jgi:hypothetical protein